MGSLSLKKCLIVIGIVTVSSAYEAKTHAKLQFLDQHLVQSLAQEFQSARPATPFELAQTTWSCTLYGVRSKLQKETSLSLFKFSSAQDKTIANRGSHIFRNYGLEKGSLIGKSQDRGLHESLRVLETGELISQMTLSHHSSLTPTVLAYSKCTQTTHISKVDP